MTNKSLATIKFLAKQASNSLHYAITHEIIDKSELSQELMSKIKVAVELLDQIANSNNN